MILVIWLSYAFINYVSFCSLEVAIFDEQNFKKKKLA